MKITKKIKNICLCVFSFMLLACLGLGSVSFLAPKAEETSTTQAYVMYEDRETRGFWYTGYKGTKEYAQNRIFDIPFPKNIVCTV